MKSTSRQIKLSIGLVLIATVLLGSIPSLAQQPSTNISSSTKWQIPSGICGTDCSILIRTNESQSILYVLDYVNWNLYVLQSGATSPVKHALSTRLRRNSPSVDFVPVGTDFVLLYDGYDKVFKYQLSTHSLTELAPTLRFRYCTDIEYGWLRKISRFGMGGAILSCFSTPSAQRANFSIGIVDANTGTPTIVEDVEFSVNRSTHLDWYNLVAGQDNQLYKQRLPFSQGSPPTLEISRRTVQNPQWNTITISENDLVGWDTARFNKSLNGPPRSALAAVDSLSNIYLDFSWVEKQADNSTIAHFRLGKVNSLGQKIWVISEDIPNGSLLSLVDVTSDGKLLLLRGNASGVRELQETTVTVISTSTPTPSLTPGR